MKESEYKLFFISFTIKGIQEPQTYRISEKYSRELNDILCNIENDRTVLTESVFTFETYDGLTVVINLFYVISVNFLWDPINGYIEEDSQNNENDNDKIKMIVDGADKPLVTGIGDKPVFCNFFTGLTSYNNLSGFSFFKDEDEEDFAINLSLLKVVEINTAFLSECERECAHMHLPE